MDTFRLKELKLLLLVAFQLVTNTAAGTPFNHSIYRVNALKEFLLTDYDTQVRRTNATSPTSSTISVKTLFLKTITIHRLPRPKRADQ